MEHYMIGPIEEAFGKSVQADIPEPGSNNDFLWGVIVTVVAGSILYMIVSRKNL